MAKTGFLEIDCPSCGMTQMQTTKSVVSPNPSEPSVCGYCKAPLATGDTAVLLSMKKDVRKTAKWVTFMGVVVAVGLIVNFIIVLAALAAS